MDQFMAEIRKIPPVTRFLCGSSLGISLPVMLKVLSPYTILYTSELVFSKLQLWRLYTSFFLGSGGINYIFEFVMLYRMSEQLESGPYFRRSADLAWQLLFACGAIIVATIPLKSHIFTRPLLVALAYVSSSLAPPGAQTSLFGLVTLPVQYFPYVMIGLDFLMAGPAAAAQSVAGAVIGHGWWWSVWGGALGAQGVLANFARAPEWMRNLVGEHGPPPPPPNAGGVAAGLAAGGVQVVPPRRAAPANGPAEHNWGIGQRLG